MKFTLSKPSDLVFVLEAWYACASNAIGYIMGGGGGGLQRQDRTVCEWLCGSRTRLCHSIWGIHNLRYVTFCCSLLEALAKLCPPSTRMEFISVTFDTVTITINIPANKNTEIIAPGKVGHVLLNFSYSPWLENCTCWNVWSQLAFCLHDAWHVTLSPDRGTCCTWRWFPMLFEVVRKFFANI